MQKLTELTKIKYMNIWNSYIWTVDEEKKGRELPGSYEGNLCSCEKKAWNNPGKHDIFQAFFLRLPKLR